MANIKTVNEESLVALGDAIRTKTGGEEPLVFPTGMIDAIEGIEAKVPVKPIELTGDCSYVCRGPIASAYIEANGDTITTKDISNATCMFHSSTLESIPFDLNFRQGSNAICYIFQNATNLQHIPDFDVKHTSKAECGYAFFACHSLEQVPYIYNAYPAGMDRLFYSCTHLREIPEDYFDTWNFTYLDSYTYGYAGYMFQGCFSLRSIPPKLLSAFIGNETVKKNNTSVGYYNLAASCYSLDELIDIPIVACELTTNALGNTVQNCCRLKNFTFETNEDGSPKTAKWKSQTLELSSGVGYSGYAPYITDYNSGITADKEVKDNATYQALKSDPDWFTTHKGYSRYNHDSAVATINSLPDTSAYGTNTIRLNKFAGTYTDGGSIENLTDAEIAVAAAKGWTVALVNT